MTALWRILVPISVPGLVSVGVYTFMISWNEYLFALTLTRTDDMRTVPIGIQLLMGQHSYEWNQMMAMSILGSIPVLVLFLFFQRLLHRRHHRRRGQELDPPSRPKRQPPQKEKYSNVDDRQGPARGREREQLRRPRLQHQRLRDVQRHLEISEELNAPLIVAIHPDEVRAHRRGRSGGDHPARAPLVRAGRDPLGPRRTYEQMLTRSSSGSPR